MIYLIAGVIALVLLLILSARASSANTSKLIGVIRKILGGALLVLAGYLGFQRHIPYMMTVGGAGLALLGWDRIFSRNKVRTSHNPGAGNISSVRSEFIEMELDQNSNKISGQVVKGKFAGADLDNLSESDLVELYRECFDDEQSRSLLEAYFDRREPNWREKFGENRDSSSHTASKGGKMTKEEAYEILGLNSNASKEDIIEAHKRLIGQLHPDRGGTNFLAATINRAKDTLLGNN